MSIKSRLIDKLDNEESVSFGYIKEDSSLRIADGTRMEGDFSQSWDDSRGVNTYWDNEVNDYRCFKQDTSVILFEDFKQIGKI